MNIELMIIPLITGLVAVIKQAGLPSKYAPVVALLLGVFLVSEGGFSVVNVSFGLMYGLSAMGLWETGTSIKNFSTKEKDLKKK